MARADLLVLQERQAESLEQNRQLQREIDGLRARETPESAAVPYNQQTDAAEVSRLRGEVAALRTELKDLPTNRAQALKQKLAQMPDKGIPELQFLTDKEWISAAWDADLDTDDGTRLALRQLRDKAVEKFLNKMRDAIKAYAAANNDMLPASLLDLKGYFQMPVTDEMLQRYKLMQSGQLSDVTNDTLVRKFGYVDPDYDSNQEMSINGGGGGSFNHIEQAINDAARRYALDNYFQAPTNPEQITSYLSKTIDTPTIQKYLDKFAMNPPSSDEIIMAPVLRAYFAEHPGQYPKGPSDVAPYITTPEQQAVFDKLEARERRADKKR
jgi:hypothetical protein